MEQEVTGGFQLDLGRCETHLKALALEIDRLNHLVAELKGKLAKYEKPAK